MRVLTSKSIPYLDHLLRSAYRLNCYVIICRIFDLLVNLRCQCFLCDVGKFRRLLLLSFLKTQTHRLFAVVGLDSALMSG